MNIKVFNISLLIFLFTITWGCVNAQFDFKHSIVFAPYNFLRTSAYQDGNLSFGCHGVMGEFLIRQPFDSNKIKFNNYNVYGSIIGRFVAKDSTVYVLKYFTEEYYCNDLTNDCYIYIDVFNKNGDLVNTIKTDFCAPLPEFVEARMIEFFGKKLFAFHYGTLVLDSNNKTSLISDYIIASGKRVNNVLRAILDTKELVDIDTSFKILKYYPSINNILNPIERESHFIVDVSGGWVTIFDIDSLKLVSKKIAAGFNSEFLFIKDSLLFSISKSWMRATHSFLVYDFDFNVVVAKEFYIGYHNELTQVDFVNGNFILKANNYYFPNIFIVNMHNFETIKLPQLEVVSTSSVQAQVPILKPFGPCFNNWDFIVSFKCVVKNVGDIPIDNFIMSFTQINNRVLDFETINHQYRKIFLAKTLMPGDTTTYVYYTNHLVRKDVILNNHIDKFCFAIPAINDMVSGNEIQRVCLEPVTITNSDDFNSYVTLSPNPVHDELRISNVEQDYHIKIFDMVGKEIVLPIEVSNTAQILRTDGLMPSLYFIKIHTKQGIISKAFIKQ